MTLQIVIWSIPTLVEDGQKPQADHSLYVSILDLYQKIETVIIETVGIETVEIEIVGIETVEIEIVEIETLEIETLKIETEKLIMKYLRRIETCKYSEVRIRICKYGSVIDK